MIILFDGVFVFVCLVCFEDDVLFCVFFVCVIDDDLCLCFFQLVKYFSYEFIVCLIQFDYVCLIVLVVIDLCSGDMFGVVCLYVDVDYDCGEYGILICFDFKGYGIGWWLMMIMIEYVQWLGLNVVEGQVLCENSIMLVMCQSLGFKIWLDLDDLMVMVVMLLVQDVQVFQVLV